MCLESSLSSIVQLLHLLTRLDIVILRTLQGEVHPADLVVERRSELRLLGLVQLVVHILTLLLDKDPLEVLDLLAIAPIAHTAARHV